MKKIKVDGEITPAVENIISRNFHAEKPNEKWLTDNSAREGVFGRVKNEMFYNQNWQGVSIQKFISILNFYLKWYNEKRIKISLGNMSPLECRHSLGFISLLSKNFGIPQKSLHRVKI